MQMIPMRLDLPNSIDKVPQTNSLSSYLPLRSSKNSFNWDVVIGLFLGYACKLQIRDYSQEKFVEDCRNILEEKLDEAEFWHVVQRMYFENGTFLNIAPVCQLFRAQKASVKAAEERIALMYFSLLNGLDLASCIIGGKLNFLEQQIVETLRKKLAPLSILGKEHPYLPYLSDSFSADLTFLSSKPKYMLSELKNFLEIYGFLYSSQLALNLLEWRNGSPKPKPLYFIMDNEKASSERTEIQKYGWRSFHEAAHNLFPILSMLENLQLEEKGSIKYPLWYMAASIKGSDKEDCYKEAIMAFAMSFKEQRNLNTELKQSSEVLDWIDNLIKLAIDQFSKDLPDSSRYDVNRKYVNEVVELICEGFAQSRGRAGRVLVLNQDRLILLTNVAIGSKEKLRFHELILAFENRGIYFDKQTQQKLIEFYERIGNVDRMSDSGDAVYVRKTI